MTEKSAFSFQSRELVFGSAHIFKGYGASNSRCAAGYGGGFGEEEVMRHGLGFLGSRI